MKKRKFLIIIPIIVIALIIGLIIFLNLKNDENVMKISEFKASETQSYNEASEEPTIFNVLDFGAIPNDEEDDTTAIQTALNKAKDELINNTNKEIQVFIPEGTFHINSTLQIFSNTKLLLDDNAIIVNQSKTEVMLAAYHLNESGNLCTSSSCTHGQYSQWKNITIEGGTWNANNDASGMHGALRFRHGEGLTIKNTIIMNSSGHTINPSASKTVLIDNVTIKDQISTDEKVDFANEVIHLDSSANGETSSYPVDGTPMEDVTIQNCTFENVLTAIGCHSIYRVADDIGANPNNKSYLEKLSNNIKIINNKFINIKYYAINAIAFRDMKISGNIATGKNENNKFSDKEEAWAFIHTRNCTGDNVIFSDDISNGGNKIENFEYELVRYAYNLQSDEKNNNLQQSGGKETNGLFRVYYYGNDGEGTMEYNEQELNKKPSGITLPKNAFLKSGYKFKNWNVKFFWAQKEEDCESIEDEGYLQKSGGDTGDLKWHHSYFDLTAQWIKRTSIEVSSKPTKLTYIQNKEDIDLDGGIITSTYEDESTDTINLNDNEVKITGFNNSVLGTQTINVEYEGVTTSFEVEIVKEIIKGDINDDGNVDLKDILLLRRFIAMKKTQSHLEDWNLNEDEQQRADINKDSIIDLGDVLKLRRYLAASKSPDDIGVEHPDWLEI